jgi:hypothetical protein
MFIDGHFLVYKRCKSSEDGIGIFFAAQDIKSLAFVEGESND